jgi:hypothetical protein
MPLKGAKSTQPFTSCLIDLIPPVNGCKSILVVVDRGNTKGAILIPMDKTLTQEGVGQLLLDNLYNDLVYRCQGFTKSHSGPGPNELRTKGLKEYSDSYSISNYLRFVLGSK